MRVRPRGATPDISSCVIPTRADPVVERNRTRQNIEYSMVLPVGELDGKIAIVTGTSRGVGVGIAHELLRAGATVIGCSRSELDGPPGAEQHEEWVQRSAQMVGDQGDLRAIDAMVSAVADSYGRIDILVNNAGGTVP